jgi:AraC-like DNA-binding protein
MLSTNGPYCYFIHGVGDNNRPNAWSIVQRRLTYYLLVCCISGEEEIIVAGVRYKITPRSSYLVAPGVLADLGSKKGNRPAWIHFDAVWNPERKSTPYADQYDLDLSRRKKFLQPSPREIWGVDLPVRVPPLLEPLFAESVPRIVTLVNSGDRIAYLEAITTLSNIMFAWVAAEWKRRSPGGGVDLESRLARAELFARQSLGTGFSVSDFARAANFSRSQFTALYTKARGISPGHFLRQERIRQAEALLARSDLPLAKVGALVGYADPTVFGRVFRAAHGISPKAWRKKHGV